MATRSEGRRDITGSVLGLLVFLGGVTLLLLTFRLAYQLFNVPPQDALGVHPNVPLAPAEVGNALTRLVLRILLLLIMGIVASLVANKGILLYTHSRAATIQIDTKE